MEILDQVIAENKISIMQTRNQQAYQDSLSGSNSIVFAWGDVPKKVKARLHNNEIMKIHKLISDTGLENNVFVLKYEEFEEVLTNKKRPRHPSRKTLESYVKVNGMKVLRKFLYIDVNRVN